MNSFKNKLVAFAGMTVMLTAGAAAQASGFGSITKSFSRPKINRPKFNPPSISRPKINRPPVRQFFQGVRKHTQTNRFPKITHKDARREAGNAGRVGSNFGKGVFRGFFSKRGPQGNQGGRYPSTREPGESNITSGNPDRKKFLERERENPSSETENAREPEEVSGSFLTRRRSIQRSGFPSRRPTGIRTRASSHRAKAYHRPSSLRRRTTSSRFKRSRTSSRRSTTSRRTSSSFSKRFRR